MGMVGGGLGAFIGAVHRMAAALDNEIELVCGAFSSDAEKSRQSGEALYLPPERVYGTFEEMILKEKALPEGERMDFVAIVTPNHMHYPPAKMAMEHGFPVMCDKPLAFDYAQAVELAALQKKTGLMFGVTHNYSGYPMVKEARAMIATGQIGKVRKVVAEYPQGWLATLVEATGQKQAAWRTDPSRAGAANCVGDIGTHAAHLLEYVTGLKITEMCADLTTFVPGRVMEDDANILIHLEGGAKGILHSSQISVGEENNFNLRVYGETGGLWWHQMEPNTLQVFGLGNTQRIARTGIGQLSESSLLATRIPAGHPEGYIEAFAILYRNYARTLRSLLKGETPDPRFTDFPGIEEGVRGMAFIATVLESAKSQGKWTKHL
ncbi:MAG: Gfo/Idh/MocA family oxidoreductase [Bernardetiaceae bacterium]|nr:Gfo/Idh/MocA family oxidoreductase [Bernardetiaceae bacterium]